MSQDIESPASKKPRPRRAYAPRREAVNFKVPREFVALCEGEAVQPAAVLKDFIADLCGIAPWSQQSAFDSLGPQAQEAARAYHRVACQARREKARDKAAQQGQSTSDAGQREA